MNRVHGRDWIPTGQKMPAARSSWNPERSLYVQSGDVHYVHELQQGCAHSQCHHWLVLRWWNFTWRIYWMFLYFSFGENLCRQCAGVIQLANLTRSSMNRQRPGRRAVDITGALTILQLQKLVVENGQSFLASLHSLHSLTLLLPTDSICKTYKPIHIFFAHCDWRQQPWFIRWF